MCSLNIFQSLARLNNIQMIFVRNVSPWIVIGHHNNLPIGAPGFPTSNMGGGGPNQLGELKCLLGQC